MHKIWCEILESEGNLMSALPPNNKNNSNNKLPEPFGDFFKSVNQLFNEKPIRGFLQSIDDLFKAPFPPLSAFQVNTVEHEDEFIVSAELPGVKKEQIRLNIVGNYLTISVENNEMETEEDETNQIYRKSFSHSSSSRTIYLPQPVSESKIKASYRDGLLRIRIPLEKGKQIQLDD
jgi:HSP20 family protein